MNRDGRDADALEVQQVGGAREVVVVVVVVVGGVSWNVSCWLKRTVNVMKAESTFVIVLSLPPHSPPPPAPPSVRHPLLCGCALHTGDRREV